MRCVLSIAPLALLGLSGCATFGTNVSGRFNCTAPKGGCAPTSVIDSVATGAIGNATTKPVFGTASKPARTVPGADAARTGERVLRILFPAHVDAQGTLHEEAVAYAVAEGPDWAVAKRGARSDLPISDMSLAARDGSPSTPREAIAGAAAPGIEGFDAVSPLDARTPRSLPPRSFDSTFDPGDLPNDAAIDAAKARASQRPNTVGPR